MSETMLTQIALERQMSPLQADIATLARNIASLSQEGDAEHFAFRKDRLATVAVSLAERIGEMERNLPVTLRHLPQGEKPVLYLASPYSDTTRQIRHFRYREVSRAAAWLKKQGYSVLSPISMGHSVSEYGHFTGDFSAWAKECLHMLESADALIILNIPGARESMGVNAEYAYAARRAIPVSILNVIGSMYTLTRGEAAHAFMRGRAL